jgi:hypothetical protein
MTMNTLLCASFAEAARLDRVSARKFLPKALGAPVLVTGAREKGANERWTKPFYWDPFGKSWTSDG